MLLYVVVCCCCYCCYYHTNHRTQLIVVYFKDGHDSGLKAIIKKEQISIEKELKLLVCKHASSTSSITQSADIAVNLQTSKKSVNQQLL